MPCRARHPAQADAGRAELRIGQGGVQRIGATERLQRGEPRRGTGADVGSFAADERDAVAAQQLDATARAEIEGPVEATQVMNVQGRADDATEARTRQT